MPILRKSSRYYCGSHVFGDRHNFNTRTLPIPWFEAPVSTQLKFPISWTDRDRGNQVRFGPKILALAGCSLRKLLYQEGIVVKMPKCGRYLGAAGFSSTDLLFMCMTRETSYAT
jgi:hypothetical protein